jgi:tripartite-type tricarboxylate transporter receptor subunit TctC
MMGKLSPDGYTIGYASFPIATNHICMTRLGYDTLLDFAPVERGRFLPNVLAISTALLVQSVQELIAHAEAGNHTAQHGDGNRFNHNSDHRFLMAKSISTKFHMTSEEDTTWAW